jgi:hypothetical protein
MVVDTNVLVVDGSNNRVGVGVTNPSRVLDVSGDIVCKNGSFFSYRGSKAVGANDTSSTFTISDLGNPLVGIYIYSIVRQDTSLNKRLGGILGIGSSNGQWNSVGSGFSFHTQLFANEASFTSISGTTFTYNPNPGGFADTYHMSLMRIGAI